MTDCVRLQICDAIVTLLSGITTGGGYHNTIPTNGCKRAARILFDTPPDHWPLIDVGLGEESRNYDPCNLVDAVMKVTIIASVRGVDLDGIENLIADIENRLATDPTLGGLCVQQFISYIATDGGAWEHSTAQIDVMVNYLHTFGAA